MYCSKKEAVKKTGLKPCFIERALHSKFSKEFAIKSGPAKNSHWMIDTDELLKLVKKGAFTS